MAEYIERDAVIEFGERQLKRLDDGEAYRRLDAWLNSIPAADVQEVGKLTEAGKSLLKYCPEAINQLAARINDNMDRMVLYGEKREES